MGLQNFRKTKHSTIVNYLRIFFAVAVLALIFIILHIETQFEISDIVDKNLEREEILYNRQIDSREEAIEKLEGNFKLPSSLIRGTGKGEDVNEEIRMKRIFIKKMIKDAWNSYVSHAWGFNELAPFSQNVSGLSKFGLKPLGIQIVDALDTLYIAGMDEEYQKGKDWIEKNLDFKNLENGTPIFEINSHLLGGLLSLYSLTGDALFKDKAHDLGHIILKSFPTDDQPFPNSAYNKDGPIPQTNFNLGEVGSLHMELTYLSQITGHRGFAEKAKELRSAIKGIRKSNGLYSNFINVNQDGGDSGNISFGNSGKLFYETLLKSYLQNGDAESRSMYLDAINSIERNNLIKTVSMIGQNANNGTTTPMPDFNKTNAKSDHYFISEMHDNLIVNAMDSSACSFGALFSLGSEAEISNLPEAEMRTIVKHMRLGLEITATCHAFYTNSSYGLAPSRFYFDVNQGPGHRSNYSDNDNEYRLLPEVLESYFVLWRLTQEDKYRKWAWELANSIQSKCQVKGQGGYAMIRDVYSDRMGQDNWIDLQPSYFLSGTLKYLYLIFSSNELFPISEWVFNSVGHPISRNQ